MLNLFGESLSPSEAAFAGGVAGGIAGTILVSIVLSVCVFYIFQVIAWWKLFKKAGEKGWKSLIPIYSSYIFFKIVGMQKWFWCLLGLGFLSGIIASATGFDNLDANKNTLTGTNIFGLVSCFIIAIFSCVIQIIQLSRISKVFGHGVGYTLGLFFLQPIFLLILGLGSSKYDKKVAKVWME